MSRFILRMQQLSTDISALPEKRSMYNPLHVGRLNMQDDDDGGIYQRFAAAKPADLTWAKWAEAAGVSRTFFGDVKAGADPSVGRTERVLAAIGLTMPEFFGDREPATPLRVLPNAEVCAVLFRELARKMSPDSVPSDTRLAILGEALQDILMLLADDPDAARDPALALRVVQGLASRLPPQPS
jgi:hypothetical protein